MTRNLLHQKQQSILRKTTVLIVLFIGLISGINAQAVTEIITDYEGYWKSGHGALNAKKPVNGHNLLAFSFNGLRVSTGVDDLLLGAKGETYFAADFRALPVKEITKTPNSNTKIGVGQLHDGSNNSQGSNRPDHSLAHYITDGKKGLDIGTGVANLPVGTLDFTIDSFSINAIADGIPDILVTQIADPSGSVDKYEFLDEQGKRVGKLVNISLNNISPVGNWTADFYEANVNPRVLTPGFTNTDRAIRLWAADFTDFGIDASNINQVKSFRINLSGNSDVAFVAYNHNTMNVNLPEQLKNFRAVAATRSVKLNWDMVDESGLKQFMIEFSYDGRNFGYAGTVAAGAANGKYHFTHNQEISNRIFYRIVLENVNGKREYSDVISVNAATAEVSMSLYPNPAVSQVTIRHPQANAVNQLLEIRNHTGLLVQRSNIQPGSAETTLNVTMLNSGMYMVIYKNGVQQESSKLIIR